MRAADEVISIPGQSARERTLAFDYDRLSQLVNANIGNIGGSPWTCDYYYKKDGNIYRKKVNDVDTFYKYNTTPGGGDFDSDIMTDIGDESLIWDANGRLAATPEINFVYNDEGKLRYAAIGEDSISLKYDLKGNRVWKQSRVSGQTTTRKYIVDVAGRLPTILCEIDPCDASDPNGSLKYSYIYTPGGQILAQQAYNAGAEPNEPNDLYFYIHDRLGSVRLVINDAADVNNSYTYSPSGEMFASECTETVYNPFLFTGQWWDQEIQQYYLRARMYYPYLGIFTSRDPVMGKFQEPLTLHVYLYCMNDPLNRIDPRGEYTIAVRLVSGVIGSVLMGGVAMATGQDKLAVGAAFLSGFVGGVSMNMWVSSLAGGFSSGFSAYMRGGGIKEVCMSTAIGLGAGLVGGGVADKLTYMAGPGTRGMYALTASTFGMTYSELLGILDDLGVSIVGTYTEPWEPAIQETEQYVDRYKRN